MKNFRKSKLFVLATVLTIVFGAFAVNSADAGCGYGGYGGYGYSSHYAPTYTSHYAPSYGHFAPTYGCGYAIPTHTSHYAPSHYATPSHGGLYW